MSDNIKYKCENCKLYRNNPRHKYHPIENNKYPIFVPGENICYGYPAGCSYFVPYHTDYISIIKETKKNENTEITQLSLF